jgi:hypothetical protein
MKLLLENWRKYVKEEELILKWSRVTGISPEELREGISRRSFLRGGIAVALSSLIGCDTEYGITPIRSDIGGSGDTGGISWEELPDCIQSVDFEPSWRDPRWQTGIPISEFKMIGRNQTISTPVVFGDERYELGEGGNIVCAYKLENTGRVGPHVLCVWRNVPDTCDFWNLPVTTWAREAHGHAPTARASDYMEKVWETYERIPLLEVNLQFPIVEGNDGKRHIVLSNNPTIVPIPTSQGGDRWSECAEAYLETIGKNIED